jgi:uncharacterized membrane protein
MDMLVGFLMNMFYPILGITNKPIAEIPIVLTMAGVLLLLCVIAYFRDKDYNSSYYINLKEILNSQVLFLSLIPFMTIFGTYMVNYYHTNILLMIMIVVIALVALVIGFTNWIDKKYYPYAIGVMAIALVWHIMLITPYVNNHDGEMVVAKSTIENGFWDYTIFDNIYSILSNNIFTPMVYFICSISLTWIYKAVFPIWISIFPLVVYVIVRKYLDCKMAFLCSFITISSSGFWYSVFPTTTKQFMAEFFISLIVLAICGNLSKFKKMLIMTMFGMGLIWSHYGTSYLFMIGLIFTTIFLRVYKLIDNSPNNYNDSREFLSFTGLYLLLILSWYIYVSGSSLFYAIVGIGNSILSSIWTGFLSPDASRGAYMIAKQVSGVKIIAKYMNLGIAFFMVLGMFKTLWNYKKSKFDAIYIGLSLYLLGILVASVAIPHFAVMGPGRLYMLSLITLTPFCIFGGIYSFKNILKIFQKNVKVDNLLKIMYCYMVIILLFSTGFIYELANDHPTSVALSQNSVANYGTMEDKAKFYGLKIMGYDVNAMEWLSDYNKENTYLYFTVGYVSVTSVCGNYGDYPLTKIKQLDKNTHIINKNYVWLRYANTIENIGYNVNSVSLSSWFDFLEVKPLLRDKNKIYDNGGSQILLPN